MNSGQKNSRTPCFNVLHYKLNTKKLAETCVDVLNKRISGLDTEDRYFVPVKIRMGGTT